MGRRFSGQRICSETDCARPSSLIVTSEDLCNLPDAFEQLNLAQHGSSNKENKYGALQNVGSRLSRRFGGTIRLKKRLSSVPELLLRDINGKPKSDEFPTMDPKASGSSRIVSSNSIRKPLPPLVEHVRVVQDKPLPPPQTGKRYHNGRRIVSSPLAQQPITYVPPQSHYFAMPASVSETNPAAIAAMDSVQNENATGLSYQRTNRSDVLLEEIMNLYTSTDEPLDETPVLKQKIDEFIDTVHESLQNHKESRFVNNKRMEKRTDLTPKIIQENADGEYPSLDVPNTPDLRPSSVLDANISSPEYVTSGGSEESDCPEFSDLDSIVASIKSHLVTSDESYYSCGEEVIKERIEQAPIPESNKNHYSFRHAYHTVINPKVLDVSDMFGFSDSDDEQTSATASVAVSSCDCIDLSVDGTARVVEDSTSSIYSF